MSARRTVASFVAMVAVLAVAERPGALRLEPQGQVRDLRPGEARPPSRREIELVASMATAPATLALYGEIAKLQEDRGALREAEATLLAARSALPTSPGAMTNLAYFYNRTGQFDQAVAALEDAATISPSDAAVLYLMATFYQQRVQVGRDLDAATRLAYMRAGIRATDRTLLLVPEHIDALMLKGLLLREEASAQTDATTRGQLNAEADQVQARAIELQKTRTLVASNGATRVMVGGVSSGQQGAMGGGVSNAPNPAQSGYPAPTAPVRVGGNIKTPTKILDVRPVYPAEAQAARVSGVVILELTIDGNGLVRDAKILRSIPMLDQPALDAVKQWQFTQTMLNGAPVPVIMTVTVNFTMQE